MAALLLLHEEMDLVIQRYEEEANKLLKEIHADLEEARSRGRLACACKDLKRPIYYPLTNRIVEMVTAKRAA